MRGGVSLASICYVPGGGVSRGCVERVCQRVCQEGVSREKRCVKRVCQEDVSRERRCIASIWRYDVVRCMLFCDLHYITVPTFVKGTYGGKHGPADVVGLVLGCLLRKYREECCT